MPEGIAIPHPDGERVITPSKSGEAIRDRAHHQPYKAFKPIHPLPPEQRVREEQAGPETPIRGVQRDLLATHDQATQSPKSEI